MEERITVIGGSHQMQPPRVGDPWGQEQKMAVRWGEEGISPGHLEWGVGGLVTTEPVRKGEGTFQSLRLHGEMGPRR